MREMVDIHHVDGRVGTAYDDVNKLIGLCRTCHHQIHHFHKYSREFQLKRIAHILGVTRPEEKQEIPK